MRTLLLPASLLVLAACLLASAVIVRNGLVADADRTRLQQPAASSKPETAINNYYSVDYPKFRPLQMFADPVPQLTFDNATVYQTVDTVTLPGPWDQQMFQNYGTMDLIATPASVGATTSPNR
jgi:hypothetical protein